MHSSKDVMEKKTLCVWIAIGSSTFPVDGSQIFQSKKPVLEDFFRNNVYVPIKNECNEKYDE